jgi:hypothetical protein
MSSERYTQHRDARLLLVARYVSFIHVSPLLGLIYTGHTEYTSPYTLSILLSSLILILSLCSSSSATLYIFLFASPSSSFAFPLAAPANSFALPFACPAISFAWPLASPLVSGTACLTAAAASSVGGC